MILKNKLPAEAAKNSRINILLFDLHSFEIWKFYNVMKVWEMFSSGKKREASDLKMMDSGNILFSKLGHIVVVTVW